LVFLPTAFLALIGAGSCTTSDASSNGQREQPAGAPQPVDTATDYRGPETWPTPDAAPVPCSPEAGPCTGEAASCGSQFSPEKGFSYRSDPNTFEDPSTALERARAACEAERVGDACDPRKFLTREAAICIARADGLKEGVAPWFAAIRFHGSYRRVVWNVRNTLLIEGPSVSADGGPGGSMQGVSLTIDAITGSVLGRQTWRVVP
jgi:hypothetical protein